MDIFICIPDSLCCTPKTNTTFVSPMNFFPKKKKQKQKQKKTCRQGGSSPNTQLKWLCYQFPQLNSAETTQMQLGVPLTSY